jgi:hypothetical protein
MLYHTVDDLKVNDSDMVQNIRIFCVVNNMTNKSVYHKVELFTFVRYRVRIQAEFPASQRFFIIFPSFSGRLGASTIILVRMALSQTLIACNRPWRPIGF